MDSLTRRDPARPTKWTHMGAHGKWAARTCKRHLGDHNLANLTRAPSGQTTRPDPNGGPRMARPPERTPSCRTTKRHDTNGRPHTARLNDPTRTDALTRHAHPNDPTRTDALTRHAHPNARPHPAQHGTPDQMDTHGSKRQTGCPDVHKAPGRSQLSKSDTGTLEPNDPTRP